MNFTFVAHGPQVRRPGTNCFNGTGAVTIAPEPYALAVTLGACEDACDADAACAAPDGGIVFSAAAAGPPPCGLTGHHARRSMVVHRNPRRSMARW